MFVFHLYPGYYFYGRYVFAMDVFLCFFMQFNIDERDLLLGIACWLFLSLRFWWNSFSFTGCRVICTASWDYLTFSFSTYSMTDCLIG